MKNARDSDPFHLACAMEEPLSVLDDLLTGLMYLADGLDDGAAPVARIAEIARDKRDEVEKLRCKLFHESHPRKAELDREGWPTGQPEGEN